jgi:hypothetical protein
MRRGVAPKDHSPSDAQGFDMEIAQARDLGTKRVCVRFTRRPVCLRHDP